MADKPLKFGAEKTRQEKHVERAMAGEIPEYYDPSSIPGHAEQVMANEIAKSTKLSAEAKEGYYKRFGTGPGDLPADFCWVRVAGPDGRHSYNASVSAMEYKRRGYRPATVEDLQELGFGMPETGQVQPDGTIRREDTALFIVDGERARANEKAAEETAAAMDGVTAEQRGAHGADIWAAEEERKQQQLPSNL